MRLLARRPESSWLHAGVVIDGHEVERPAHRSPGGELRYLARSPEGMPAMVIAARRTLADRRERSRFRRLSAARAALDHPAAIRVHAATEYANHPVLITDPYPECTFGDLLEHDAPLPPESVVALLAPVADALDRAHAVRLVHRALSAESLLLAGRERLLLDSFGLLASEDAEPWAALGARDFRYMSPEQVRGLPALPASNVYSLTALAVHALTGEPPFTGDQPTVMYAQLVNEPTGVSRRRPELGNRLDAVVRSGMAKEPGRRPQSATELVRGIADALGVSMPRSAEAPAPKPQLRLVTETGAPVAPARPRRRGRAVLAAALVAASVAAGALAAVAVAPFGDNSPAASRPIPTRPWTELTDERAVLRDSLAAADTPLAQAEAASRLAGLYEAAARTGRPRALAAAAREVALGYDRLAAAAELNDDAGYAAAARAVERAEAQLSLAASRHRAGSGTS